MKSSRLVTSLLHSDCRGWRHENNVNIHRWAATPTQH